MRQAITHLVRVVFQRHLGAGNPLRLIYDVAHNMAKIEKHALRFTYTFGLGLLSLFLFLILTVSGLLLMFVYVPSTEQAYLRMQDLHSSVSFGYILRGMHFWAAIHWTGIWPPRRPPTESSRCSADVAQSRSASTSAR